MISQIISFIKSKQLINSHDTIFAAVSGGLDSMVMLHCLYLIKNELNFNIEAIHINHGIRGNESDKDEALVKQKCDELGLKIHVCKLSGFDLKSSEEELRIARYEAFDNIVKSKPNAKIATAHNLDDQVETFFMRLAKGSKIKGLSGIPVSREGFIRPILFLSKAELKDYADNKKIKYREDFTNKDISKMRNNIRHGLTPKLIEIFGSEFYSGFSKSLEDLVQANKIILNHIESNFLLAAKQTGNGLEVNLKQYIKLSEKERHMLLESCISMFYPLNFGIPSGQFYEFDSFVKNASVGSSFLYSNNLCFIKNRSTIVINKHLTHKQIEMELYPEREVYIEGNKISLKQVENSQVEFNGLKSVEYVCGENIKFPLIIRNWQDGDFFYPLGSEFKQKISDFFVNQKLDLNKKKLIPLIFNGSEIVWIVGFQIDNRYKVHNLCKELYKLEIEKIN